MTPEQIDSIDTTLLDRIYQWKNDPMSDAAEYHRQAIADREAFKLLIAEHAAMTDALRWRTTQEITTASGADGVVFVRGRDKNGQFWFDTCHIDELREGDEWLPVPL